VVNSSTAILVNPSTPFDTQPTPVAMVNRGALKKIIRHNICMPFRKATNSG
jgi:hypothetical protein